MAMRVEVNQDDEDAVRARLAADGIEIEEPKETADATEAPAETETEHKAATPPAPAEGKDKRTKEEAQPGIAEEKKEDWNSLPEWAKKRIIRDREEKRQLRDRIEDERADRTMATAPAGGVHEAAAEAKESEVTYSGIPEPVFEDFEKSEDPYRDFTKAHSKWAKDEAVAQIRAETQMRERGEAESRTMVAFDARQKEAAALIPDYSEALEEATDLKASPAMQRVIYSSDMGPFILHYLAKNPDECRRIYALAPADSIRAMGRLEAKLETEVETLKARSAGKKSVEPPKKKSAPPPEPEKPLRGTEPKGQTLRDMSGPDDRVIDMVKFNPEVDRKWKEQHRLR